MKKPFIALFFVFSLLWPTFLPAFADGMIIPPPNTSIYETGQKAVIWYEGGIETLILSTTFQGKAENFGWLVPTPFEPQVSQASDELFTALDDLTKPKYRTEPLPLLGAPPQGLEIPKIEDNTPTIIQTTKVGIFDITVLKAKDAEGLTKWLEKNDYPYPADREYLLKSYIDKDWYFVVAKVDSGAISSASSYLQSGHASPIQLTFKSDQIVYPLKISGLSTQENIQNTTKVAYSFENGETGWFNFVTQLNPNGSNYKAPFFKFTTSNEKVYTGNKSALLSYNTYDNSVPGGIEHNINGLKIGRTYTVSAYVSSSQASGSAYITAVVGNYDDSNSQKINLNSSWQRVSRTFTPTNENTYINLLTKGINSGENVYWDSVQVEEGTSVTEFDPKAVGKTFYVQNYLNKRPQDVTILLYVFDKNKKELPGFTTSYASWVTPAKIKKLAFAPDTNKPWKEPKDKFYLTKLSRTMSPSSMADDLILRDADNNDAVNADNGIADANIVRFLGIIVLFLVVDIGFVAWFLLRRRRKNKQSTGEVK
jgi:hypothetical protein